MRSQCFVCIFMWVYVLQFMCCMDHEQSSKIPASGPFKTSIISITDCTNPSKPYVNNSPVIYRPITHNGTLSGSITFLKDTKNLKIKLKGFIIRNGKTEPFYLMNNLNCHGMALHFMCASMNIKYDRKTCLFFKGTYTFENMDVNQLLHLFVSKVKYGHVMWRSEAYSQAGTFVCKEFDSMTEPA